MRKAGIGAAVILGLALVTGGVFYGLHVVAQIPGNTGGTNADQQEVQEPRYACSISVPKDADEQTLAGLAKIAVSDAERAVLAQFPDAKVLKIELDDENGCLV